jgi:serine/threonine protein kinase
MTVDKAETQHRTRHAVIDDPPDAQRPSLADAAWESLASRYQRRRLLGAGGAGDVHLVFDVVSGRDVALKLLRRAPGRWLDEARATARVSHPHVVSVLDAGAAGEGAYLVLEYVDGPTLRTHLMNVSGAAVMPVLRDVAAGLAAAHAASVLHLDVKPDNVLIGSDGRARVADFGIARISSGGACIELDEAPSGTPAYMAPELWAHEGVCDRTDVWSFAVLACEAIAGERPMAQASTTELVIAALSGTRIPPAVWDVVDATVDSAVADVLRSSLGRDRRARPTMSMVEEALSTWLHHASSST